LITPARSTVPSRHRLQIVDNNGIANTDQEEILPHTFRTCFRASLTCNHNDRQPRPEQVVEHEQSDRSNEEEEEKEEEEEDGHGGLPREGGASKSEPRDS
jgi:hypothetical protein